MEGISHIYAKLICKGKRKLNDVPKKIKKDVEKALRKVDKNVKKIP